jgi:hypothetical protein
MRLYYDIDLHCFIASPGNRNPILRLDAKRSDVRLYSIIAVQNGAPIDIGNPGIKLGAKLPGQITGDYLASNYDGTAFRYAKVGNQSIAGCSVTAGSAVLNVPGGAFDDTYIGRAVTNLTAFPGGANIISVESLTRLYLSAPSAVTDADLTITIAHTQLYNISLPLTSAAINDAFIDGVIRADVASQADRFALTGWTAGQIAAQRDNSTYWQVINPAALSSSAGWAVAPRKDAIDLNIELEITSGANVESSQTLTLRVADDINRGTEGVPVAADPAYPIPAALELIARKGEANGYAGLDSTGKVPAAQLPSSALILSGDIDASADPNYPAALVGHTYYVTVAGKVGGASGKVVEIGDAVICKTEAVTGNEAAVGASWFVIQKGAGEVVDQTARDAAAATSTTPGTLWVSVSGSNSTGVRGRSDLPFATLTGAVAVAEMGDQILIGPGLFIEPSRVILRNTVKIRGAGMSQTTIKLADGCATSVKWGVISQGSIGGLGLAVNSGMEVTDLTVDCNGANQTTASIGAVGLYGNDGRIERVRAINWSAGYQECFVLNVSTWGPTNLANYNPIIRDCIVEQQAVVAHVSGVTAISIAGNGITNTAPMLGGLITGCHVRNVYADNTGADGPRWFFAYGSSGGYGAEVSNNSAANLTSRAGAVAWAYHCDTWPENNTLISGNAFVGVDAGIYIYGSRAEDAHRNVTIVKNTIRLVASSKGAIGVLVTAGANGRFFGVNIDGNVIVCQGSETGISADHIDGIIIANNRIETSGTAINRTVANTNVVEYGNYNPTTGVALGTTLATLTGAEALTNKTLNGNSVTAGSGIIPITLGETAINLGQVACNLISYDVPQGSDAWGTSTTFKAGTGSAQGGTIGGVTAESGATANSNAGIYKGGIPFLKNTGSGMYVDWSKPVVLVFAAYQFAHTPNGSWRVMIGKKVGSRGSGPLTAPDRGIGIQAKNNTIYTHHHNGTTLTDTSLGTTVDDSNIVMLMVVSDGLGNVSYYKNYTLLGTFTGGPTGINTNATDYLCVEADNGADAANCRIMTPVIRIIQGR